MVNLDMSCFFLLFLYDKKKVTGEKYKKWILVFAVVFELPAAATPRLLASEHAKRARFAGARK